MAQGIPILDITTYRAHIALQTVSKYAVSTIVSIRRSLVGIRFIHRIGYVMGESNLCDQQRSLVFVQDFHVNMGSSAWIPPWVNADKRDLSVFVCFLTPTQEMLLGEILYL